MCGVPKPNNSPEAQGLERLKIRSEFRENPFGKQHRPVFLAFIVMDGQDARIKIQTLHPQLQAFEEPQPLSWLIQSLRGEHTQFFETDFRSE